MLVGRGALWPGQMRTNYSLLRGMGRPPAGVRTGGPRHKKWSPGAPEKSVPPRHPEHTNGISGLTRWSLLVLFLGRGERGEVLEQVREVVHYLLRTVARQCEVHTSQKLRRALRLYSAYSRLWGEEAALSMLASLRRTLASKSRHLLLSAVCFSNFNWEQEKIPDERLLRSAQDLESVGDLRWATVVCHACGKRQVIDQKVAGVDYCACGGSLGYIDESREHESWLPFIEREQHIVWRQRHPVHSHLFAYKVYGSYDDVSLSSFMEVQLNSSYRTEWDDTALQLQVLDSHEDSNSALVYWLVKFPHFFANRDYIFKRRFMVDSEKREVVIMSEAVSADFLPEEKGVHRVNEYWSTMVIRALGDMEQPGIEYTLTYFDNPGTSLPQSITNFIAVTGFPNFLKKLHKAALHLQSFYEKGEDVYVSLPAVLRYPLPQKDRHEELPSPSVPSDELEVASLSTGVVTKKNYSVEVLSEEDLPGENQDTRSKTVNLSSISAALEGSVNNQRDDKSETEYQVEETRKLRELSIKSTKDLKTEHVNDTTGSVEDFSVNDGKTTSLISSDTSKETMYDTSVHVKVGGKQVSIDLLEAMEVVAPDMEKKSILIKKIEELSKKLQNSNGKHSIILQKLRKLRHKLKSFREDASMRREHSMRHMEELANRDHYRQMNIDDKTLTQLEMLFEAMRYVLQVDKDMRTGKLLLEEALACSKAETEDVATGSSQPADMSQLFPVLTHVKKDVEAQQPDEKNESLSADSKTDKSEKKNKRTNKESQIPKDPPPTDSSGGAWSEGETSEDTADMNSETGNFANELGSVANTVSSVNSVTGNGRPWSVGFSVPYISAWWEAGKRQEDDPLTNHCDDAVKTEEEPASSPDAQTNALFTQLFYILSLGWIFYSKGDVVESESKHDGMKSVQCSRGEREGGEEGEYCEEARWYWHPLSSAYRAYAWIFSASRASV